MRAALVLSLTPLFSTLLAGCFGSSSCDGFKGGTYHDIVELTPDEYAARASGETPAPTSSPTTTGDETTAADTTGDDTGAPMLTPQEVCQAVCAEQSVDGTVASCSVGEKNMAGNIPIDCEIPNFCEGRRHACVRSHGAHADGAAASWLARAAHDEAASIHAFLALAAELTAHGAHEALVARLHAAAADEARHAAIVARLAAEHGAAVPPLAIAPTATRDLLAIAVENAAEGCVRETWAALSAAHQARHADDPRHRALYRIIAADEARHAELAWALDAWLLGQLTPAEQTHVEHARSAAARDLRVALAAEPHGPELAALGLPDPATARHLAASLDAALWSQAA